MTYVLPLYANVPYIHLYCILYSNLQQQLHSLWGCINNTLLWLYLIPWSSFLQICYQTDIALPCRHISSLSSQQLLKTLYGKRHSWCALQLLTLFKQVGGVNFSNKTKKLNFFFFFSCTFSPIPCSSLLFNAPWNV